uniref:KIAA0232 n=1 Tax=Nothobranchius kuhntae TaxID=321403 RepID=A0A1A8HZ38_NOTKU
MRPVSTDSDGPAPPENLSCPYPLAGPLPASEMSLLQSLGPVQSWLGQELEKCGIDAMIYTRYVLSLLLHDSYDYDLQDQENDIFLGWEKGTGKKWGKSKKKGGTDLSLEEMKKQAAVQCLRSASDENSGIESLVEELCSKLKDIQNKQKEEKRIQKRSDGSQSPERAESPSTKDQVEMYYEAFPPLSEKPVCLQEIMTVWNKARACAYSSSSSSAAPQTSTDTSSPKDCNSDGEATKERNLEACGAITTVTSDRGLQRRSKREKENRYHGGAAAEGKPTGHSKRQTRHRSEGKYRPRSSSSGSSEAGSSSSGNQGDSKSSRSKAVRIRHKSREATNNKRTRNSSTMGGAAKQPQLYKKVKRPLKEIRKDPGWAEAKESGVEVRNKKEYMEEPLWYTEPITEYFVPFNCRQSKLETKYRSKVGSPDELGLSGDIETLPEKIQGISLATESCHRAYLAAGSFVDGHFVEGPGKADDHETADFTRTLGCPQPEDSKDLDDKHLSEFTHFYEVDIYQSILDTSASDAIQESRILSMIRQKSKEQRDVEAECCLVLDGLEQQGESAILAGSQEASGSVGFLTEDLENMVQMWGCYSPSTSEEVDGESFMAESPVRLSPLLDSVSLTLSKLPKHVEETPVSEATSDPSGLNSSCFSVFELQYDSPTFPFPHDSITVGHENTTDSSSCLDPHSNKQSRLLIWTKNSAFDETEHCSNLSTRTCSPWSHSEETRSDNELGNAPAEEAAQIGNKEANLAILPLSGTYLESEILEFLQEDSGKACEKGSDSLASSQTFTKKSKLESVCGIALEEDESKQYNTGMFSENTNQQSDDYSSGIIKDIWTAIGDEKSAVSRHGVEKQGKGLFSDEPGAYCCNCLEVQTKEVPVQGPLKKAVQRSEYHLWEGKNEDQGLAKNKPSKVDAAGDYMTPSKPWDLSSDKESTSFILGGVYGELKTLSGDKNWAVVPPGEAQDSLLQCAAAAASVSSSDMLTITGKDVFMNTGSRFAPGHRPLWRPLVSFGQSDQASKGGGDALNKGFSLIFHEDLLGSYRGWRSEEQGLKYPFASLNLNNPFSQVLHVECSFEPEDMASFSPGFKPKSILCSDSESEAIHSRIYGFNRTQYRAIRISPRTHFRPISASELSPRGASDSETETDKEEMSFSMVAPVDVFDDPQADLKPLEEDAECEGPYYGKSELESGKFLPRLKKSGMEKSAQTSLDSQEGPSTLLPIAEQESCLNCESATASSSAGEQADVGKIQKEETSGEKQSCLCSPAGQIPKYGIAYDYVGDVPEFPLLNLSGQGGRGNQQDECWWQNTVCPPLFPGSQCAGSSNI